RVAGRWRTGLVLGLGVVVQLLALATDPHRVYIVNHFLPDNLFYSNALFYDLRTSHLFARPGEIVDVLTSDDHCEAAAPARPPTSPLPPPGKDLIEPSVARRYCVFAEFRPWWCWQWHLDTAERPVDLARTAMLLASIAAVGLVLTTRPWS